MEFHKMFTITAKAGCFTGIAAIALLYVESQGWLTHAPETWARLSTAVGERRHSVLREGSQIDLNTATEIAIRDDADKHEAPLTRGEARFHVENGENTPFVVSVAGARLEAAGTDFSVRLINDSQIEVLVEKGHVIVTVPGPRGPLQNVFSSSPPLTVSAGELFSLRSNAVYVKQKLSRAALERKTAWTDGWIWFAKVPLPEAVAEFNRYHDQQLVLVDPRLARLEVGGRFRSTDLDSFIATLEHSFDVQATSQAAHGTGVGTIYLTSRCLRARQQCNWPMVQ